MKVIKLSVNPWPLTQEQFNCYTPNGDGKVGVYEFKVNDDTRHCDYWIVRGGIQSFRQKAYCPPENVIFLLDEVYKERSLSKGFIAQFASLIGLNNTAGHPHFIYSQEFLPWFFPGVDYKTLRYQNTISEKNKELCIIGSDATWLDGHKKRFAFTNQLIGHFKDRIDVYGRGYHPFENKFDILKKYKYSIALENNIVADYFTEKINECYLADCMPVYYGCPNIIEYYDSESIVNLDYDDLRRSVQAIEKAIEERAFEQKKELILSQKERYFSNYHFPDKLIALIEKHFKPGGRKTTNTIYSEKFFYPYKEGMLKLKLGSGMVAARLTSSFLATNRSTL
jgi:hypothetical protein